MAVAPERGSSPDAADAPPAPRERTAKQYVLSWCQKAYYIPASAVISLPKCPKPVEDGAALASLLGSKSPEVWREACDPKHMLLLKGREGKSVYSTFTVKEHPLEERFIRLVAPSVCDRLFPKLLEELSASDPPKSERQRLRQEVLNFRSSDINNGRVQLNPEFNEWERCTEPDLKSCIKHPVPRPVKRKTDENVEHGPLVLPPGVKFVKRIDVNDEDGFQITQRPGAVFVTQWETTPPVQDAAVEC